MSRRPPATRGALLLALLLGLGCDATQPEAPAQPIADTSGSSAAEALVRLDDESLRRAGVELVAAAPYRFVPEVEAYGRVLDPALAGEAVANREAALAAFETAQRELARVEGLARDAENASAREVEAARAAEARARADLEMAHARVAATLGTALEGVPDLSSLARKLGRREAALIRIDVPGGGIRPRPQEGAHLVAYPDRGGELASRFLGPAPDTDPNLPGWGFLFLVGEDPPPVGTPVRGRLRAAGEPQAGVRVPAAALVRHAGRLFVFVERGAGAFERRAVVAGALPDGGWFVSEGLGEGERVVASGAQALLSAGVLADSGSEESD
jgi:hypothetical protein